MFSPWCKILFVIKQERRVGRHSSLYRKPLKASWDLVVHPLLVKHFHQILTPNSRPFLAPLAHGGSLVPAKGIIHCCRHPVLLSLLITSVGWVQDLKADRSGFESGQQNLPAVWPWTSHYIQPFWAKPRHLWTEGHITLFRRCLRDWNHMAYHVV